MWCMWFPTSTGLWLCSVLFSPFSLITLKDDMHACCSVRLKTSSSRRAAFHFNACSIRISIKNKKVQYQKLLWENKTKTYKACTTSSTNRSMLQTNLTSQDQASNFTEAMAVPFWGVAVVPSNLNKRYGILNHWCLWVLFSNLKNEIWALLKTEWKP